MKVYELLEELNKYNSNTVIEVVVNGCPKPFGICFGSSEGCTPLSCDCVDLMVETPTERG